MKNVLWFLIGVIGGFVVAHVVNKDPRGHELLAEVDARISEFTDRIGDAYREQEARSRASSTRRGMPRPKSSTPPRARSTSPKNAAGDAFDDGARMRHPMPSKPRRTRHPEPPTPPSTAAKPTD